ncbi:hypothetical protein E4U49_005781 [Claviceps purpurea]|nr:hypothetical protein E4U49_005781 [Claviceps purpurea]
MKFFSPFFIFVFGALVTPIIGHAVPNVEGGVDVVERDFAGAPAHFVLEHVTRMAATALNPSAYVVAPTSVMPANAPRVVRWSKF